MMRSAASDRVLLALLAAALVASLGLKALVDRGYAVSAAFSPERAMAARLDARGFATRTRPLPLGSILVEARRGDCRLIARDATWGFGAEPNYALDARAVGPVHYLYGGDTYAALPSIRMRFDRSWRKVARVLGISRPVPLPVALARSPACPDDLFGLAGIEQPF